MKNLFPIGSVVVLKEGTKRIMICGRIQTKVDDGVTYDYSACYYPEGILDPKELFLFNHEDIMTVYFLGFQDLEEFEYRESLIQELNKKGGNE